LAGYVYHVINRGVGRMTLFEKDADFAAFERVLADTQARHELRLLSWCVMPNHWHLVVWPRKDGQLGRFMQDLTITHVRRWQEHRHGVGEGHVYQGRYKSFPVERDGHLRTVNRYVERNALRAGLVERAEDWRWGSLWRWVNRGKAPEELPVLSDWPTPSGGRPGTGDRRSTRRRRRRSWKRCVAA
jgi:putative transposase